MAENSTLDLLRLSMKQKDLDKIAEEYARTGDESLLQGLTVDQKARVISLSEPSKPLLSKDTSVDMAPSEKPGFTLAAPLSLPSALGGAPVTTVSPARTKKGLPEVSLKSQPEILAGMPKSLEELTGATEAPTTKPTEISEEVPVEEAPRRAAPDEVFDAIKEFTAYKQDKYTNALYNESERLREALGVARQEYQKQLEAAQDEYQQDKERAQWGQVAEMIGRSLVTLTAAFKQARTGRDVTSGLDSRNQVNWLGQIQDARQELQAAIQLTRSKYEMTAEDLVRESKAKAEKIKGDFETGTEGEKGETLRLAEIADLKKKAEEARLVERQKEMLGLRGAQQEERMKATLAQKQAAELDKTRKELLKNLETAYKGKTSEERSLGQLNIMETLNYLGASKEDIKEVESILTEETRPFFTKWMGPDYGQAIEEDTYLKLRSKINSLLGKAGASVAEAPAQESFSMKKPESAPLPAKMPLLEGLAAVESGGDYKAVNKSSSATGKYQFLWSEWGKDVSEFAGRPVSQQEFLNSPDLQEEYAAYYHDTVLVPEGKKLQRAAGNSLRSKGYDRPEYAQALIHYLGATEARNWLRTGQLSEKAKKNNMDPKTYLAKVREGLEKAG